MVTFQGWVLTTVVRPDCALTHQQPRSDIAFFLPPIIKAKDFLCRVTRVIEDDRKEIVGGPTVMFGWLS
jgi:hypothetical protein